MQTGEEKWSSIRSAGTCTGIERCRRDGTSRHTGIAQNITPGTMKVRIPRATEKSLFVLWGRAARRYHILPCASQWVCVAGGWFHTSLEGGFMSSRGLRPSLRLGHCGRIEPLEDRRLLAVPGSLDPTFSGDGKATFSIANLNATDVAVQADGKAVVAGTRTDSGGNVDLALARFTVDGQPDSTFGNAGLTLTPLFNLYRERIHAVAVAPDGKIVVVGTVDGSLLVYRYNTDGTVDTSFNGNGRVILDLDDFAGDTEAFDVAVQPDGMVVVVGATYKVPDYDFFVIRLTTNGELDRDIPNPAGPIGTFLHRGFNADGVITIGFGGGDEANAVALDGAGNIYVAGNANISGNFFGCVAKLSPLGAMFDSFNGDGKANFQVPGKTITVLDDLIVQSDGKVIVAGVAPGAFGNDVVVARFTADGQPDFTFGENNQGFTVTDLGGNDSVRGITATPTGGGGGFIVSGGSSGMAAVKYTANGLLDTTFGTGGKLRTFFGGNASIAPGPGRRFMLAGGASFSTERILLQGAREVSAGALDITSAEGTTNTGSFFVGRPERLPFATRVFFNIGGTTTLSATRSSPRDWNMSGMSVTPTISGTTTGTGFVDIPANETLVILTFTPDNDSLAEPTESATFSIAPNSIYEIASPNTGTIRFTDDDTANNSIGTTTVAKPPKQVGVGQEVQAAVTWTVPTGGWRELSTIQLRLRNWHDDNALAVLTFDEATNSFSVESTPGADNPVSLILSKCTFQAAGPTAPMVTILFTFVFNAPAANERFRLDVGATNDTGEFSGFTHIGELHVHKKPKGDALALPV
jgi:uncharacterized delta-60 repeat protein